MDIIFGTTKHQKLFNDRGKLTKKYGPRQADLIKRRLDDLRAAEVLEDIGKLPPARCHELVGDREGQLSIDLVHPYRLIIVPANNPIPRKEDGGLDWSRVTAVEIVGVEDTHG
jgi:plasmid maintenance system killer protein